MPFQATATPVTSLSLNLSPLHTEDCHCLCPFSIMHNVGHLDLWGHHAVHGDSMDPGACTVRGLSMLALASEHSTFAPVPAIARKPFALPLCWGQACRWASLRSEGFWLFCFCQLLTTRLSCETGPGRFAFPLKFSRFRRN